MLGHADQLGQVSRKDTGNKYFFQEIFKPKVFIGGIVSDMQLSASKHRKICSHGIFSYKWKLLFA